MGNAAIGQRCVTQDVKVYPSDLAKAGLALWMVTCALLLGGCAPTTQSVTATRNGNSLAISGLGFTNISPCAQLALIGLPPPQAVIAIGPVGCGGGSFTNFNWAYEYRTAAGANGQCQLNGSQAPLVTGTDLKTSGIATSKPLSLPWGPNCALICGTIGKPACPAGCLNGVNSNPGEPNGTCVACGGEGQPPCSGNVCQGGLHLNGIGRGVCTASCGHVNQSACLTDGSAGGVTNVFHCYNGSTMSPQDCVCVFDPNSNPCQEITSGGTGVCVASVRIPQGCR